MIIPSPELEFDLEGTLDIKVFLKRQTRDDEVLLLKELLQELFPQDFELHHYLNEVEEIRNWSERTDDWTTFSGLLSDLESDGYDEAPHPVGLTVPLRSYQLQSLQFMLDAEKRKGGLLSINYHKLPPTSTSSEPLLYSASLGHLMDFREGVSCGGFLCEEMGLGKTIEVTLQSLTSIGYQY
jgi:SNF2 family DNA or RNA helicase